LNTREFRQANLNRVTTIAEAAITWGKNKKTIRSLCLEGKLVARQSCSVWLISVASLEERWGKIDGQLSQSFDQA
jgi:hypothetical protein